jgi:rubrerythrin
MNRGLVALPIDKLVAADWNYKTDSEFLMDALVENMRRNGQIVNVITRELGHGKHEVVNGNHRLEALRKIGASEVVCFNLGKVSKEDAIRLAIETNETNFEANMPKLAAVVTDVVEAPRFDMKANTLPYTEEEVKRFKEMKRIDWNQRPEPRDRAKDGEAASSGKVKQPKDRNKNGPMFTCPHCGHEFDEE